jgi:hypothetical protein
MIIARTSVVVGLFVGTLALSTSAVAQQPRKIADNVYMMENPTGSSNSTFVVTDEGIFVWDADIRSADQVVAAIRAPPTRKSATSPNSSNQ